MNRMSSILSLATLAGFLAAHADTVTVDGGGKTITDKTSIADLAQNGQDVTLVNGTWDRGSANLDWSSTKLAALTIGNGAIFNAKRIAIQYGGTVDAAYPSARLTVAAGGKLVLKGGNNYVNDGRVHTDELIVDGGTVESSGGSFAIANAGQSGKGTSTMTGRLVVLNGGSFTQNGNLGVAMNSGSTTGATSGYSDGYLVVDNGTLVVDKIIATPDNSNDYGKNAHATISFKDADVTLFQLYGYNYGKIDVTFDGATIHTRKESTSDANFLTFKTAGKAAQTCTIGEGGVTIDVAHKYSNAATFAMPASGTGFFKKTGAYPLTFRKGEAQTYTGATICEGGTLYIPTTIASTDLQAVGGTIDLTGATLPDAGSIALTLAGENGAFNGLDTSKTYAKLTLGEGARFAMTFSGNSATPVIAAEAYEIAATAESPLVIVGSGTVPKNTKYVLLQTGVTVDDLPKFALAGTAANLTLGVEDGALVAHSPTRALGEVTWAGTLGANWWGTDCWNDIGGEATTFLAGDTPIFAEDGAAAVMDADVETQKVVFNADAAVSGEATLTTPEISVAAGKTATLTTPLGQTFVKTGAGTLVLGPTGAQAVTSIEGILDYGGQTQPLTTDTGASLFKDGGELRNGTFGVTFTSDWCKFDSTTFTIGQGAKVFTLPDGNSGSKKGELNMQGNAKLIIDGGEYVNQNNRGGNSGNYIGCDQANTAEVRIQNGGLCKIKYGFLRVGMNKDATGIVSIDDGTLEVAAELSVASGELDGSTGRGNGILAVTNGLVRASEVCFAKNGAGGTAKVTFRDSTVETGAFSTTKTLAEGSSLTFDGATLVCTAKEPVDFLPDLKMPVTIGKGGLTISNENDIVVSTRMTGEGGIVKTGMGALALGPNFAMPQDATLTVPGGVNVTLAFGANGFVSAGGVLVVTGDRSAPINISLDVTAGVMPESGVSYPLFASVPDDVTLVPPDGFEFEPVGGTIAVRASPATLTWEGKGEDGKWSTDANWTTDEKSRHPTTADSIVFTAEYGVSEGYTTYDLADDLSIAGLKVDSGTWVTDVGAACFSEWPLTLNGGAFALEGAAGRTNPFSPAEDANVIAGILDLGGATQTMKGKLVDSTGVFRTGGEIRNGNLTFDPTDWFRLHDVLGFTIGTGAKVTIPKYSDSKGQVNFYNTDLTIDGGTLEVLNQRNVVGAGAYIGNDGDAIIRLRNGGTFRHPNIRAYLAYANDGKGKGDGALVGEGHVDLGTRELILGHKKENSTATLALTNSTLTCGDLLFGYDDTSKPGPQLVTLVATTGTLDRVVAHKVNAASSVLFDDVTLVHNGKSIALLPPLSYGTSDVVPYTIAEGGLTIVVDNVNDSDEITLGGAFAGTGGITLTAAGNKPKSVRFSGIEEKGFEGALVVNKGITVTASGKTFAGGLVAKAGSTLDLSTSTFGGDMTFENGVNFTGLDTKQSYKVPVEVLKTTGRIDLGTLEAFRGESNGRFFVTTRAGVSTLCYGHPLGFMIFVR